MLQSLEKGKNAFREAKIHVLDYSFQKEELKYKNRMDDMEEDKKAYNDAYSGIKEVYDAVTRKMEKYNKKAGSVEPDPDKNFDKLMNELETKDKKYGEIAEKLKKMVSDSESVEKDWNKLMEFFEECELKDLELDEKILDFDFNRMKRLEKYKNFSIRKFEEYELKTDDKPNLFERNLKSYDDLLETLGAITF
ncbi:MAG: hypothetical protein JSV92_04485, partial [archaeon]